MGFMQRFTELLEKFEWPSYSEHIDAPLYRELVKIVAEVMELPPTYLINIEGTPMQASMVKEVYLNLTSEHLESVMLKYRRINTEIKSKKAYLRAMLYNEVFEYEASIVNDVNVGDKVRRCGYV